MESYDKLSREELIAALNRTKAELLEVKIELAEARQEAAEYKELAFHDVLTGMLNRRGGDKKAEELFLSALAHNMSIKDQPGAVPQQMAMICLDVDLFKKVNDIYGNLTGDAILRRVAELIKNRFRKNDPQWRESEQAWRYGGEEFIIALVGDEGEDFKAIVLARTEQLRRDIKIKCIRPADDKHKIAHTVTASFGVAFLTPDSSHAKNIPDALRELQGRADAALYAAKDNGRNCIVHEKDGELQLVESSPDNQPDFPTYRPGAGIPSEEAKVA